MLIAYRVMIVDPNRKDIHISRKFGIDGLYVKRSTGSADRKLSHSLTSIQGAMLLCSEPAGLR